MEEKKPEGIKFDELTKSRGKKVALAKYLGFADQIKINIWRTRSVPAGYAPKVAAFLGCHPEEISASYKSAGAPMPSVREPVSASTAAGTHLTDQEKTLIQAFRELQKENKEQARLVMQVAFGADPRQQTRSVQQDKLDSEVMAGFDMAELGTKIDAYYGARSATEKIAAADKVVSFIDRRQRQEYPPDKEFKRASDLK